MSRIRTSGGHLLNSKAPSVFLGNFNRAEGTYAVKSAPIPLESLAAPFITPNVCLVLDERHSGAGGKHKFSTPTGPLSDKRVRTVFETHSLSKRATPPPPPASFLLPLI